LFIFALRRFLSDPIFGCPNYLSKFAVDANQIFTVILMLALILVLNFCFMRMSMTMRMIEF